MSCECPLCSGDLLRHISKSGISWRCTSCHQRFSDSVVNHVARVATSSNLRKQKRERPGIRPQLPQQLFCTYTNSTAQMQLVRVTNIPGFFLEQTVLPNHQIIFVAPSEARLEIYTYKDVTMTATDSLPCKQLSVIEAPRLGAHKGREDGASSLPLDRGQKIANSIGYRKTRVSPRFEA